MPKLQLTQQFVDNPPIVKSKTKTDYFDTEGRGHEKKERALFGKTVIMRLPFKMMSI